MLIGISGKMRSGKDTVANYIIEKYGFEHLKFSKGINEIYNKFNYVDDKGIKNRQALQDIGQGIRRALGENVWVNYTLSHYNRGKDTVISDVRQDNEFIALRELGAVIILVTTSPSVQRERLLQLGESPDEDRMNHETEHIPESMADVVVVNDSSLEELYTKIDDILEPLITSSKDLQG